MHVCGVWEEAGVSRGNPCRHGELHTEYPTISISNGKFNTEALNATSLKLKVYTALKTLL